MHPRPNPILPTRLASAIAATSLLLLAIAAPATARAQAASQRARVESWSPTGHEYAIRTETRGTANVASGGREPFVYPLLVLHRVDGSAPRVFRGGEATGPTHPRFEEAQPAADAQRHMTAAGFRPGVDGLRSPDGARTFALAANHLVVPAANPDCPTCRACRTTWTVAVFDRAAGVTHIADSGQKDSLAVAEGEQPECPTVSIRANWHRDGRRAVLIRNDRDSIADLDTTAFWDADATHNAPQPTITAPHGVDAGALGEAFRQLVAALPESTDRATTLTQLGFLALDLGDLPTARDYFGLLANSNKPVSQFGIAFADFLDGNARAIPKLKQAAKKAGGILDPDLAVALFLDGDTQDAARANGGTIDLALARRVLGHDLDAGIRALQLANAVQDPAAVAILVEALMDAGRMNEAATLVSGVDQSTPLGFALVLDVAHAQGQLDVVIREGWARVFAEPWNCHVWGILGDALTRQGRADDAIPVLSGAVACDPGRLGSLWNLSDLLWQRAALREATDVARTWVSLAGPRRNDPARAARRAEAESRIQRQRSPDIVVTTWTCTGTLTTGRACSGTLLNAGAATVPASTVSLMAWTSDGTLLDGLDVQYGEIPPGATLAFEAALVPVPSASPGMKKPPRVELNATPTGAGRTENRIVVGPGW